MKRSKKVIALAGILGIAAIGGTFAYFNQTLTAENVFDTGTYDSELVEKFSPSDGENWEPGANVNKDVTVKNDGSLPIVVRAKFEEEWVDKDEPDNIIYRVDTTEKPEMLVLATPADAQNKFENVYQSDPQDGKAGTDVDDSVVFKKLNPDGGWVYNPADGYYYYQHVLAGVTKDEQGNVIEKDESTKLLDSVTLAENVDLGAYDVLQYYAVSEGRPAEDKISESSDPLAEGWHLFEKNADGNFVSTHEMNELVKAAGSKGITYMRSVTKQKDGAAGYSNANYTLTVTAQTVQATEAAVKAQFGIEDLSTLKDLGCDWVLTSENEVKEDKE